MLGWLFTQVLPDQVVHRLSEPTPDLGPSYQLSASRIRDGVDTARPFALRVFPLPDHKPIAFQSVQHRIEGSALELDALPGAFTDGTPNGVSVLWPVPQD